ncbi:MAG: metallophosphoesterase [Pseudomonadota bacterium]
MSRLLRTPAFTLLLTALWSTTALAAAGPSAPPTAANEFHFIVLGDSQFDDPATFNRTIDQVRMLQPAFVVQVGDLINGYEDDLSLIEREWARFRDQIGPLGAIPFFAVPGNHDVFNGQRAVDPRLERLFEAQWGALYYSFNYRNAAFVVLNSDSSTVENGIDPEQLDWLANVLEGTQAEHRFVFLHRPPRFLEGADTLHELFVRHDVDYVIYGHHHHYHHELRDGVHYVMTNNSGTNAVPYPELGGFEHLLQVAVRDDEVSVASIEVDAVRPLDFVGPEDNYGFFALARRLTGDEVVATAAGENRYSVELSLNNPLRQSVDVYLSCGSSDGRWSFAPRAIPVIRIDADSTDTVSLEAAFEPGRVPESIPSCDLEVPYQSRAGTWIRFEQTVTVNIPGFTDESDVAR